MPDIYQWLRDGVPITLVIDLFEAERLDSSDIYAAEPADLSWLPAA